MFKIFLVKNPEVRIVIAQKALNLGIETPFFNRSTYYDLF